MSLEIINPYSVLATTAVATWQYKDSSSSKSSSLLGNIQRWWRYRRTLNELSQLSDRELNDIGVIRADLSTVANRASRGY